VASTRVYILAKELGVKSSAIVKKCQDEGLEVKNHMSVISAGLAATIREWFSEGENLTTVETAQKVDLEKVRIKKKPKAKANLKPLNQRPPKPSRCRPKKNNHPLSSKYPNNLLNRKLCPRRHRSPNRSLLSRP